MSGSSRTTSPTQPAVNASSSAAATAAAPPPPAAAPPQPPTDTTMDNAAEAAGDSIQPPIQAAAVAPPAAVAAPVPPAEVEDEESEDDEEILEESPCGRWNKRREEVKYRDVPGVDAAYLAMDTEEGVEVVWNEASFSEAKKFKAQEEKLKKVFEALTLIGHPNIVKFHRFWTDNGPTIKEGNDKAEEDPPPVQAPPIQKPRLIFITEYVSSGSLKQFLRRTKKNARKTQLSSWKRWCVQILSALRYLHLNSNPPIVHGNLTCDTIFIQHNGLVKIGSVAPDIIHQNVKTCRDNIKNLHYLAPEYADSDHATTDMDIYAFGMAALEMAALEIQAGEDAGIISDETIEKTISSVEDERQRDFIRKCLAKNPADRPTAHQLLFHPVLFEVHSCKLLAAHRIVNQPEYDTTNINETIQAHYGADNVIAFIRKEDKVVEYRLKDFPATEKLEKFTEDVKNGIYPITAFGQQEMTEAPIQRRSNTPEGDRTETDTVNPRISPEYENELRRIFQIHCTIYFHPRPGEYFISILLKLEDDMNRQLYSDITQDDSPKGLTDELVFHCFINDGDYQILYGCMTECYAKLHAAVSLEANVALNENGQQLSEAELANRAERLDELREEAKRTLPAFQQNPRTAEKPPVATELIYSSDSGAES